MSEKSEHTDSHYIKQLVATADSHSIETTEDIFNVNGMKLVSAGTRVDKSFYQKLVRYKLLKPIDTSLGIKHGVSIDTISDLMLENSVKDDIIGILLKAFKDNTLPGQVIKGIKLNDSFSVKLTVTQERAPEKLTHSLQVALAAAYIGSCEQLETKALSRLMTAGLLHDLGEIHIDPRILDRNVALTPELRRQIYAHPIITYLIIKEFPEIPAEISRAVLEHHERLDGSGYPRGIKGEQISQFGRILAVADLIVAMLSRSSDSSYLVTSMKLNTEKYDKDLLLHVISLFKGTQIQDTGPAHKSKKQIAELWSTLANLLVRKPSAKSEVSSAERDAFLFIEEHIEALSRLISSAGVHPDNIVDSIKQLLDATEELGELHSMAFESVYRIHELLRETRRRWPGLFSKGIPEKELTSLGDWLLNCEESLEFLITSEHK